MESKKEIIISWSYGDDLECYKEDLLEGNNEAFNEASDGMDKHEKETLANDWVWEADSAISTFDIEMELLAEYYKDLPTNYFVVEGEVKYFHHYKAKKDEELGDRFLRFLANCASSVENVSIAKVKETDWAIELRLHIRSDTSVGDYCVLCLKNNPEEDANKIDELLYVLEKRARDMFYIDLVLPPLVLEIEEEIKRFFTDFGMTPTLVSALRKHDLYKMAEASFNRLKSLERVKHADQFMNSSTSAVCRDTLIMLAKLTGRSA